MPNYMIAQLDELAATECPCGLSRRAFIGEGNETASMHMVDISVDAKVHYHKKMTEIYLILEGHGQMELDGEKVTVKPFTSILIKPLCRHRAVGKMRILVVAIPSFDTEDEWFD